MRYALIDADNPDISSRHSLKSSQMPDISSENIETNRYSTGVSIFLKFSISERLIVYKPFTGTVSQESRSILTSAVCKELHCLFNDFGIADLREFGFICEVIRRPIQALIVPENKTCVRLWTHYLRFALLSSIVNFRTPCSFRLLEVIYM